jgi:enhancer of polycomb-like protein
MDEEDAVALKILNQKRNASTQCSEEDFEEVMSFFEEVANRQHKYAYVDGTPILSYEDFTKDETFKESITEPARMFAEVLYEHWSSRRTESGNRSVQPALKVCPVFLILLETSC